MNKNEPNPDWVNATGRIRFAYEPGCFDELNVGLRNVVTQTIKLQNEHLKDMFTDHLKDMEIMERIEMSTPPETYPSEIAKHREALIKYCYDENGNPAPGIDLASGGDALAPWGWSLELPKKDYDYYNSNQAPRGKIQLRGRAEVRCTEPDSLSWVCASHIAEDYPQSKWPELFKTWASMLAVGGYLIILVPERGRWQAALKRGQPPNCSHAGPEPLLGDVSSVAKEIGLEIIEERIAKPETEDYTILFVGRKK